MTKDPTGRLKARQPGSPHHPHVVVLMDPMTHSKAVDMEYFLHRDFHRYRLKGEWFDLTAAEVMCGMRTRVDIEEEKNIPPRGAMRRLRGLFSA